MSNETNSEYKSNLPKFGGILVCGLAWGLLIGGAFSLPLYLEFPELRSSITNIECFCIGIAITGSLGLAIGILVDAKIPNQRQRAELASNSWKLFAFTFVVLAVMSGFWLPSVQ